MVDSLRQKGLRQKMVGALRQRGLLADERVLEAMLRVPRHLFLDSAFDKLAYADEAVPIGAGQTLSHPSTVAAQTQLLQVVAGEKVLEIGTGSGYQAAVLCALGVALYSVERQQALHEKARQMLSGLGYHPTLVFGDGFEGLPQHAPFAKIIVTCGADEAPLNLLKQLAVGGRMVIPLGSGSALRMCTIDRLSETEFRQAKHDRCAFVPMLKGIEN